MRIATLILGLVLMLVIGVQSCAAGVGSALAGVSPASKIDAAGMSQGAAFGAGMVFLYLLGAAFSIGVPLLSFVFFLIAAAIGFSGGGARRRSKTSRSGEAWR